MFDPEVDTPMTADQCEQSERAFLRRYGLRNMDEFLKILEECDYDQEKVMKRLGIR